MKAVLTIGAVMAALALTPAPGVRAGGAVLSLPEAVTSNPAEANIQRVQSGPDFLVVSGVPAGDTLSIRSGAGTGYRIVARAPNGVVLRNLGCGSGWCQVETRDGRVRGYASQRFLRESGGSGGGSSSSGGGGSFDMRGIGLVTRGGPLIGRITSRNGRIFALILTASRDGFTCTGSFDDRPGTRQTMVTVINCTDGSRGSAILRGNSLTFSAGGKGGFVRFN